MAAPKLIDQLCRQNSAEKSISTGSCTGLDPEWSGLTTETEFPVDVNTEVEVSCLDPGKFQTGSRTVTCSSGTEYIFEEEPTCISPGIY